MKNLKNYNVQELSMREVKEIQGGTIWDPTTLVNMVRTNLILVEGAVKAGLGALSGIRDGVIETIKN